MGQLGFFDLSRRYEGLDVKDDPLVAIVAMIPWESLRPKLKASLITGGLRASDVARKSPAGRKPWDEVVIFKALVLQALYNLSDDQAEYQLRDRLSCTTVKSLKMFLIRATRLRTCGPTVPIAAMRSRKSSLRAA